jgi:polysaccharide deacetylase 2 family uncharacterized protein YibQ
MKLFKRLFTGLLILLIIVSIVALIYILQWNEEPADVGPPEKEAKQSSHLPAVLSKADKDKPIKETPQVRKTPPGKEKDKALLANIEKMPPRQVAIIIDDIGNDMSPVRELLKIDTGITFAILPLCSHTRDAADLLHRAHREILLHLPMEPASYPREKPGNGALFTDMNDEELLSQLDKDLASVPYVSGVNNHMGSKFMSDEEKLTVIFNRLRKENLFFIDSRTAADSKALAASEKVGLPLASRRIFLDNSRNYKEIYKILIEVAENTDGGDVAPVIIIGHPYPETIRAIKDATRIFRAKGVAIVPVSKLIKDRTPRGSS